MKGANKLVSKSIARERTSHSTAGAHAVKVWGGLSLILFLLASPFAGRVAAQASPGTWSAVAPMPTARGHQAAATGLDGRIYAIGGYNGANLNTVEAYTPSTNSWTTVAPMPTARFGLAAATGLDGRIYAIGGFNGAYLNTVEAYTLSTNSWTTVAPMPTARYHPAAVAGPDGRIYVMGGDSFGTAVNTVEVYTPSTNSWVTVAPMPQGTSLLGAAAGPDGRIYAVGGRIGPCFTPTTVCWTNAAEAYTPSTNRWATVAPMPTARYTLAAATGPDGRIYAIGGYNGAWLNTVEALTVSQPPVALCQNVTVNTTPGLCTAPASVNNGSFDPDGVIASLVQAPPGPYPKGTTNVTLTVTDNGGLSASCTGMVTVVDNQPPAITCPVPQVVECTGPTGAAASFTPTFSDNCPGAITGGCTPASGSTFPLGLTNVSCTATDASANSSSCASSVRVVDTTPPTITITNPTNTSYTLNQAVASSYACTDSCSGVATCAGPVLSGSNVDTATVGSKTFTVNATDNAVPGNTASRTVNYRVVYNFSGFQPPLNTGTFGGVFKLGRTLPVKWQLTNVSGAFIGTAVASTTLRIDSVTCTGQGDGTPPFDPGTSGSSGLRYDSTANQYIFNWQTTGLAAGCYNLIMDPGDGVQRVTLVQLAP